jgi:hypothetical protein
VAAPLAALSQVGPIFRAVVSTVVPEASALDDKAWAELERLIEVALRARPPALKRRLRLFLFFIQWLPLFRYGRPFTSLNPAQRTRFLSYLEEHPIRLVRVGFWGLRTLAMLGYYGRAAAANTIGYAADPRGWGALK